MRVSDNVQNECTLNSSTDRLQCCFKKSTFSTRAIYAHSLPDVSVEKWQGLDEHLRNVADLAAGFATPFSSSEWAWNLGLLHDFGKALPEFQAYLRKANCIDDSAYDLTGGGRVNHSSAGAALAEEFLNLGNRPFGRVLAYAVAGHHAGLPDYESCDGGMGALVVRLVDGKRDLVKLSQFSDELKAALCKLDRLPAFVKKNNIHFWIRMLFSCLVDADFLETESFMDSERATCRRKGQSLVDLKGKLDAHLEKLVAKCPNTSVNIARCEILAACRKAASEKAGLFRLTVPTGGGKTLSAIAFALDHAILHGKKRIIYTIPFTSIVEQTSSILAEIFGAENVIEHHSNLDPVNETIRSRLASENWDAPIIVTTNVQFFESMLSARSRRCRKLHNIVDSVVILDEAQQVPPNLLAPCVAVLNELSQNYGATVVLSTATQPALPGLNPVCEIVPSEFDLYKKLQRTRVVFPENLEEKVTWEQLAQELATHRQVLCIVNSRRDCYDLFRCMPEGTIHLSALMCGSHRSRVIAEIKQGLQSNSELRVISTQLVEAGVDIDFPVVFRALAGLDSIAQAAGRCNREGKQQTMGKVVVFVPPKSSPRGLLHKGENTTRELWSLGDEISDAPTQLYRYFDLFYSRVNDQGEGLLKKLEPSDSQMLDMAFRSVGDAFSLIDSSEQRSVFVRYDGSDRLLDELRILGPRRELMRKLQRYVVNVPRRVIEELKKKGFVEEVWPEFYASLGQGVYSDIVGLDIFSNVLPVEDLII